MDTTLNLAIVSAACVIVMTLLIRKASDVDKDLIGAVIIMISVYATLIGLMFQSKEVQIILPLIFAAAGFGGGLFASNKLSK
jgi:hypothetical protein